jgi:hypothetical protein
MFKRMLIDTTAILKFALSFDMKNAMAIFKAHMAFHASRRSIVEKRKKLMAKVTCNQHDEILPASIVMSFFLEGKKTFHSLKKFRNKNLQKSKRLF